MIKIARISARNTPRRASGGDRERAGLSILDGLSKANRWRAASPPPPPPRPIARGSVARSSEKLCGRKACHRGSIRPPAKRAHTPSDPLCPSSQVLAGSLATCKKAEFIVGFRRRKFNSWHLAVAWGRPHESPEGAR